MIGTTKQRISTVGFVLIILAVIGLGLGAVGIVTTSIGAQSRELESLRAEATRLGYESADLRAQLEGYSSTAHLALRAAELGMVPNPYPAFVMLGTGEILGAPTAVSGSELPLLRGQAPQPVTPEDQGSPVTSQSAAETIADQPQDTQTVDLGAPAIAAQPSGNTDPAQAGDQ